MASPDPIATVAPALSAATEPSLLDKVLHFLSVFPDEPLPLITLIPALLIAMAYLSTGGGRTFRHARPVKILRIIFSPRYVFHRSHTLDLLYYIINTKIAGLTFGWLIISAYVVTISTYDGLVSLFGLPSASTLPGWLVTTIGCFTLFIAYEFAYWLDHFLAHRVPMLWEFHKVHHQAEVLSPITVYRVHPVDSVVFYNILALALGMTNGVLHFAFGMDVGNGTAFSHAAILAVFGYLVLHLQHSQVWLPFTGLLGRIFISPAHHQIHHSQNPAHFDKNMGSCLAIFDWLFGTLYVPSKEREKLVFGVAPESVGEQPHSIVDGLLTPFARAARHVRAVIGLPPSPASGSTR